MAHMIKMTLIDERTGQVLAVLDMPAGEIPQSFPQGTTLDVGNEQWYVVSATPGHAREYLPSGELTVRLTRSAPASPGGLLFPLPTISDITPDIDEGAGKHGQILELHEDDWRQVEFVSARFDVQIEEELEDVRRIHTRHRAASGFNQVHVRSRIEMPLAGQQLTLDRLLGCFPGHTRFDGIGYREDDGLIPDGFAFRTASDTVLYGRTDEGFVTELCAHSWRDQASLTTDAAAVTGAVGPGACVFVNWCGASKTGLGHAA